MQVIDGPTTQKLLPYPALINALDEAFAKGDAGDSDSSSDWEEI